MLCHMKLPIITIQVETAIGGSIQGTKEGKMGSYRTHVAFKLGLEE